MEYLETYRCMKETCKFERKSYSGPQGPCKKCGGIYLEWVNFETDWIYENNQWKRKCEKI